MDTLMTWLVVAVWILIGLFTIWLIGMLLVTAFLFKSRPHDLNDTNIEATYTTRKETPVAKESNGNQGSKLRRPKR